MHKDTKDILGAAIGTLVATLLHRLWRRIYGPDRNKPD